jgi:hypothetical protein
MVWPSCVQRQRARLRGRGRGSVGEGKWVGSPGAAAKLSVTFPSYMEGNVTFKSGSVHPLAQ